MYANLYCQTCTVFASAPTPYSFPSPPPAVELWESLVSWFHGCPAATRRGWRAGRAVVRVQSPAWDLQRFGGFWHSWTKSVKEISCRCLLWADIRESGDLRVRRSVSWSQWWKSYWKEPRIKSKPDFLRVTLPANGGRLRSVTGQRFGHILLTLVTQNDVLMQVSRIQTGSPFIGKSPNEVTGKQPRWPKACRLFP